VTSDSFVFLSLFVIATRVLSGMWGAISSKSASAWAVDGLFLFRFLRFLLGEVFVVSDNMDSSSTASIDDFTSGCDNDKSLVGAAEKQRENWPAEGVMSVCEQARMPL
jgi:hypothetical protein